MRKKILALVAVSAMWAGTAHAASSVSDSPVLANTLVAATATPVASSQTAGIIASGVSGALGGAIGGGFGGGAVNAPVVGSTQYLNTRSMTGVSGGSSEKKFGAWVQGGYTTIDGSDVGGEFDGDVQNIVAGFDYKPNDNSVVGLSLAYENVDVTTTFNRGTFEGQGLTFAPYGGMTFGNGVVLDGMVGVSKLNYDTSRNSNAATGSFDATRYMGTANLSKSFNTGKFTLTPKAGVLQVREKQDSYTESNGTAAAGSTINLGRASAGGTIALNGEKFSPYFRAMGEYDYKKGAAADLGNGRLSSNDKFGVNTGLGVNAKLNDKLTLNVEATSSANFRENLDVYGFTGRLRYDF